MSGPARLDIWIADVTDAAFLALAESDLPAEADRARASGLGRPEVARELLARRAALRLILARYTGTDPRDVRVVPAPGGKPVLVPTGASGPAFSIAHSGSVYAVAVSTVRTVGVDVEELRPVSRARSIAARWFGEAEARRLDEVPESEQQDEFMRLWTAKEALAKRHGAGLRLMKGEPGELDVQAAIDDGTLRYFSVAEGYAAAVATSEVVAEIEVIRPGSDMWTI